MPTNGSSKTKRFVLIIALILLAYLSKYSSQRILLYPSILFWALWIVTFPVTVYIDRKTFKDVISGWKRDTIPYFLLNFIKWALLSGISTAFLLVPFNYYIIFTSKSNQEEILYCSIESVPAYSAGKNLKEMVNFKIDGQLTHVDYFNPIVWDLSNLKDFTHYRFKIFVRKGVLNTYVFEDGQIVSY